MGRIEISVEFGEFKTLKLSDKLIQNLETAIAIVRASKLSNVQLRHHLPNGNVDEWDNF
jgi:hypothetical protein